jgi:predicted transcriptional regulator
METTKVKNLIIPLMEYPHMPYWGTLREAIAQLNVTYETGHHTLLVFDEAYKLVGMLLEKDMLQGVEPKFAQHYKNGVPILWDEILEGGAEARLGRPIKEFMSEVRSTIDAEEEILKASHVMLHDNVFLLPVMEGDKLIGVVRMGDVLHEITNTLLEL